MSGNSRKRLVCSLSRERSLQETFDIVMAQWARQDFNISTGFLPANHNAICYRGDTKDRASFVGSLIPDGLYMPEYEGRSLDAILHFRTLNPGEARLNPRMVSKTMKLEQYLRRIHRDAMNIRLFFHNLTEMERTIYYLNTKYPIEIRELAYEHYPVHIWYFMNAYNLEAGNSWKDKLHQKLACVRKFEESTMPAEKYQFTAYRKIFNIGFRK